MSKALYPKYFINPNGRAVSVGTMAKALKAIRKKPDLDYPGWDWFSVPGYFILAEFKRGLNDRINRRALITESKT
jgi:hypothetical protein|tara:strand:- start:322 stop:546 length:225 start_codon:yes stop_codon:yes gene_type:complete